MKAQSPELVHSPIEKDSEEQKCLQCGHKCHCGDACHSRSCLCGKCVHDPAEVVDDNTDTD